MDRQRTEGTPLPTDAELGLLRVLWQRGSSTVREVLEALPSEREVGYTTVLKLLQIMHEKGLVRRDDSGRSHVYEAAVPEKGTKRRLIDELVDRAFGGSTSELVLRALSERRATPRELREIRRMLDELEERGE